MGMFDELVPFSENFEEGEFFTLEDAREGNSINTAHGDGIPVELKIGGKWYSAFGDALLNQVRRMDAGDLPAEVAMVRQANKKGTFEYKVLATRGQVEANAVPAA